MNPSQPPLTPHTSPWRSALGVTAAASAAALFFVGTAYLFSPDPTSLHDEGGLIESMQAAIWVVAAAIGLLALPRIRSHRARVTVRWLGVLALLALAREFDLQEALNPEAMGSFGVHYRSDWWLSTDSPILPRVLWAGAVVLIGWLIVTVLSTLRPRPIAALCNGDLSAWMLVVGGLLLFSGYFIDDQLRGVLPDEFSQAGEELAELLGVMFYLGGVIARLRPVTLAVFCRGGETNQRPGATVHA